MVVKTPGAPPPPSPALMNKIVSAEKAEKAQKGQPADEVKQAKEVALDPAGKKPAADDVEPKKFQNQGIRGPKLQPLGMDPRQAKALGVLVLGDDGLEKVAAEQQLDDIWFSLNDKQRV